MGAWSCFLFLPLLKFLKPPCLVLHGKSSFPTLPHPWDHLPPIFPFQGLGSLQRKTTQCSSEQREQWCQEGRRAEATCSQSVPGSLYSAAGVCGVLSSQGSWIQPGQGFEAGARSRPFHFPFFNPVSATILFSEALCGASRRREIAPSL